MSGHESWRDADPADAAAWGGRGRDKSKERATNGAADGEAPHPEPEPEPIWIDDDDWIEAALPRRPWIAPGYALRGAVTLLVGPPSAMKSSLMLGWACSLALGRDFGRFHPTEAGSVIIYNVEDDQAEQRRRLSAVLRQFNAQPADIRSKVIRTGPRGVGTLLTRTATGTIVDTEAMAKLKEIIRTRNPIALIVDPLGELHTEEENDNTALRAVIAEFRKLAIEYGIAVIVLHHTRKGASTSPGDPDIARGASSTIGAVRIALTLTGMAEEDAKQFGMPADAKARSTFVRLDDAKQNYAPIREAEWFEKHVYELDSGEGVAAAVPWTPPIAKIASQADLAALASAIERGSPNGEPWASRLSNDIRSVRALLELHGFSGADAQKAVLGRLESECQVETARYYSPGRRANGTGLRLGDKPPAQWLDTREGAK